MSKRCIPGVALALALISGTALAADHEIKMLNQGEGGVMVFEPAYLAVEPGDTVTFLPVDAAHNSHSLVSPESGPTWNGAMGEKVTVTLDKEGIYIYQCDPHSALGMMGVIQVGEAVNLDAAQKQAEEISGRIAINKERLAQYLHQVKQVKQG